MHILWKCRYEGVASRHVSDIKAELLCVFCLFVCKMNITKLFLFQRKGNLETSNAEQKKNRGRRFGGKLRKADSVFLNSMDLPVCLEILFNCL